MTTTTDPRYPNGQCGACGWGADDEGACQNDTCGNYQTVVTDAAERCTGRLSYVESVAREAGAEVDEDGNIVLVDGYDDLDVFDTSLYCSECGLVVSDEYAEHGLSEYWEVV